MSLNQRKAGVILSYIQMALGAVIMLLYTPIMLKLLGQSEYGIYNLSSSVVSYLGIFNFSLGSAYVKYYMQHKTANDDKAIKRLNGMFLVIFLGLSALALIAGGIIVANTHVIFGAKLSTSEIQKTRITMAIMVVNLDIIMPVNMFSSYIAVNERYVYPRVIQLIKTIINPFVMLPVLFYGRKGCRSCIGNFYCVRCF